MAVLAAAVAAGAGTEVSLRQVRLAQACSSTGRLPPAGKVASEEQPHRQKAHRGPGQESGSGNADT